MTPAAKERNAMRIGFITGSLTAIGSGKAIVLPLASALAKLGHETVGLELHQWRRGYSQVDGLSVWEEPLWPRVFDSPADVLRIAANRLHHSQGGGADIIRLSPGERLVAKTLQKGYDRLSPDLVYAFHNVNVAQLLDRERAQSRLLAINLIGFGIDPSRGGAADTFPYQNLIFRRPDWDLHVAATRFEYDQYRQVYEKLGLDQAKLLHLPHAYDENAFFPSDQRSTVSIDERILLFPVNVYRRKNIELAIDVVAAVVRDWPVRLIVTGRIWDQAYLGELQARAAAKGVSQKVQFLGGVPYKRLADLYREAAVTIFTSHQETFGHGIVESLGSGTPVVGPRWIHPCREILEESHGGWCADKTIESFADAVSEIFRQPPVPDQIAYEARLRYGNRAVASRFLKAVDAAMEIKRRYILELQTINWKGLYCDEGNLL